MVESIVGVLVLLFLLYVFLGGTTFFVIVGIIAALTVMGMIGTAQEKRKRSERRAEFIKNVIAKHTPVLARKQKQLAYIDDYGETNFDRWFSEIDSFIERFISSEFAEVSSDLNLHSNVVGQIIDAITAYEIERAGSEVNLSDVTSGVEYERFCVEELTRLGWDARTTVASGDQGADIVALKNSCRAILQCKFYTSPVGNKAVQEVFAAMKHQGGTIAAVVTNHSFTRSAKQLANSTGVILLHHDDLDQLDDFVSET